MVMQYVPDDIEATTDTATVTTTGGPGVIISGIPVSPTPEPPKEPDKKPVLPFSVIEPALKQKRVASTASVLGMADKIRPFVDKDEQKRLSKIEDIKNLLQRYRDNIVSNLERIKTYQANNKNLAELVKKTEQDLKKAEKAPHKLTETQPIIDRLRKHKAIQYAKINKNGNLELFLKPIWTMAQFSDLSKKRGRMFVGCFKVVIENHHNLSVKIKNLTFPRLGNPHWSVSTGERPCWGDWAETVRDLYNSGRLYDLVTTLAAYLASNEDGNAYSRTYTHRERRAASVVTTNAPDTKKAALGDMAVLLSQHIVDTRDLSLAYLPAVCKEDRHGTGMNFCVPVSCHNHSWSESKRGWWWEDYEYKVLTVDEAAQVTAYIEETKDKPEHIELVRGFCKNLVRNIVTKGTAVASTLDYLDQAETLPYTLVAQPLIIDLEKINV